MGRRKDGTHSTGNTPLMVRMEPDLRELIEAEVKRTNWNRRGQPFTLASWLRQAAIEKLKHGARSRGDKDAAGDLAKLNAFPQEGV